MLKKNNTNESRQYTVSKATESFRVFRTKSRFNKFLFSDFMRITTRLSLMLLLLFTLSGCTLPADRTDNIRNTSASSDTPFTDEADSVNNASSSHKTIQAPGPVTDYIRASEPVSESDMSSSEAGPRINPFPDLSVPTYLTKVENTYFLVDCYHDQIIYHDNLTDPLGEWKVMTDKIDKGHTLASDGDVYLIDDTEQNRVLIFEKQGDSFIHTQTFQDIGNRPHYIIYDEPTDTFYAWSSMSGEMYLFRHNPGDTRMYLTEIRSIESLNQVYVRSFTIIGDDIYFVSGNASIIRADLTSFEIRETYPVPDSMAGMIQLTLIQDYFYITVSTDITGNQDYATILRTEDLASLSEEKYEDIYDYFIGGGTPYYITEIDNTYYLTEHRLPGHSLWSFQVENNEITHVETIY